MSFFFRRSILAAVSASCRLPPVITSEPALALAAGDVRRLFGADGNQNFVFCGLIRREYSASPVGFRAIDVASAEYAFDDYYEEEKDKEDFKSGEEGLEIDKLGISKDIVARLGKRGITKLFPIQRAVLEPVMQGRDMIGRARTGTGKTLAFGIPIMDKILHFQAKHGRGRNPLAIMLAPTRELARQVEKEFRESSTLGTLCLYGGSPINQQMKALDYGVDAVVGTPGRIIDLLNRGALNLSEIQFVVLDEADQMLNVGFAEDVERILEKMPPKHQTLMFSATMPAWIRKLTQKFLNNPVSIDLVGDSDQKLAEGMTLYSIVSETYTKPSILRSLIKEHAKGGKCIVFTQTKRDADRLAYSMGRSFRCEALHGDIAQNQREKTLAGFRDGRFNILIATDVAARGSDIPNVDLVHIFPSSLVIHYEVPNTSELFVHRSGRTVRAGKKASAILIHSNEQNRLVRGIERELGCRFIELPKITVEGRGEDMSNVPGGGRFDSHGSGRMCGSGFGSLVVPVLVDDQVVHVQGGSMIPAFSNYDGSGCSSNFRNFGGSGSGCSGGSRNSGSGWVSDSGSGFGDGDRLGRSYMSSD
ncbi:hypothetical protein ZIOFF_036255 [Zingiber officinale]|uniref:Uncharacterized protein n=1 Tax=Zingiber officinale TaxID=94328 RepID=A0A8J5GB69_ZINOF|nr:hypothetical protein ZIOFF_036255 [Zingiber officinale]